MKRVFFKNEVKIDRVLENGNYHPSTHRNSEDAIKVTIDGEIGILGLRDGVVIKDGYSTTGNGRCGHLIVNKGEIITLKEKGNGYCFSKYNVFKLNQPYFRAISAK